MKKTVPQFISAFLLIALSACTSTPTANQQKEDTQETSSTRVVQANTLTEEETEGGWILLFDGRSMEQWRAYCGEKIPVCWEIHEGSIRGKSGEGKKNEERAPLITKEKFQNFELMLEWKIAEGGNSGIYYLAQEFCGEDTKTPIWQSAPEMQILDNQQHPDAKLSSYGERLAGSLYKLIPADPQNAKPAGEWNQVKILVYNGTVSHWMNGETVVEYHLWTSSWYDKVENSPFKDFPSIVDPAAEGHIGLENQGHDVWFRNIKIREL